MNKYDQSFRSRMGVDFFVAQDAEERAAWAQLNPLQQRMCRDSNALPSAYLASHRAHEAKRAAFGAPKRKR